MERPLELCEVLEEEHRSLHGRVWAVTPADICDAGELAHQCLQLFPKRKYSTLEKSLKALYSDRAGVAFDLTALVESEAALIDVYPNLPLSDEARETIGRASSLPEKNRRTLDHLLVPSLRPATNFGWRFDRDQIRDPRGLVTACQTVFGERYAAETLKLDLDEARGWFANELNKHLVGSIAEWKKVDGRLRKPTQRLLADSRRQPRLEPGDLEYLNRRVLDDLFGSYVVSGTEARFNKYCEVVHRNAHTSALAISGGGIRSATFALGLLQGLARRHLLDKFDFISTVSGGGYIGSWLSSWMRRHPNGPRGVADELASMPEHPLQPEPEPVRHLREYSNYLTPKLGIMSGDTWALAATYVRNVILNWAILIPLLLCALAVPRVVTALYFNTQLGGRWGILILAGILLGYGLVYLGLTRPSDNRYRATGRGANDIEFRRKFLFPAIVGCVLLTTLWARWADNVVTWDHYPKEAMWVAFGAPLLMWLIHSYKYWQADISERRENMALQVSGTHRLLMKVSVELVAAVVAGAVSNLLLRTAATRVFSHPAPLLTFTVIPANAPQPAPIAAYFICFGVPLLLASFFVSAMIFVGASSVVNEDYDREWWARSSGWVLFVIVAWPVICGTVIFGPLLILYSPKLIGAVGGIGGLATILLGRSSKTKGKEEGKSTKGDLIARFLAPAIILMICAALSLVTSKIFIAIQKIPPIEGGAPTTTVTRVYNHLNAIYQTDFWTAIELMAALAALAAIASYVINVNQFSMHAMYRNRLIRAYLGASRRTRDANPFTGFDPDDNLSFDSLRPELLWASSFRAFDDFLDHLQHPREKNDDGTPAIDRQLADAMRESLGYDVLTKDLDRQERITAVFQVINCILRDGDLVAIAAGGAPAPKRKSSWRIFSSMIEGHQGGRLRRNRRFLEQNYPSEIYPFEAPLLQCADIRAIEWLQTSLRTTPFGKRLVTRFHDPGLSRSLSLCDRSLRHIVEKVVEEINEQMTTISFDDIRNGLDAPRRLSQPPRFDEVMANRRILEEQLRAPTDSKVEMQGTTEKLENAITPLCAPRPMHLVNAALNLVSGTNLAWQERKAESFTFSPLHAGSAELGYRETADYGGLQGITLGTAMTISGAAASPNMGYNSSAPLAFLLTLFNVRLGWWLGNPGPHGGGKLATYPRMGPRFAMRPLTAELSGNTNDRYPYIYLSDGGHFENLALYEMVLRRRRFIIVSDAGCDPEYKFDDLGNAIRKIRIDFGIPIDMSPIMYLHPRGTNDEGGKYCAIGTIRYSCVDRGNNVPDGTLLYIKPSIYMTEPKDVYNYAKANKGFPHETTADQFFSESQFESYRMLGSHVIDQICTAAGDDPVECGNWIAPTMEAFFKVAQHYVKGNTQQSAGFVPLATMADSTRATLPIT
jgi:hypothetical protein